MSSSSSFSLYLDFIDKEASLYFGFSVLIGATIGNILHIVVFLNLRRFGQKPCAFYLFIISIANIVQLTTDLLTRVIISAFPIDWTQTSLFFCKLHYFVFPATALISFTCVCLGTIDQYLATSPRRHW